MRLTPAALFTFGFSLGVRNLLHQGGRFRRRCGGRKLLARILHPGDYWRYAELRLVLDRLGAHLPSREPVRLLDLSGPKIGALLASACFPPAEVVAVDIMADDLAEWALLKAQLPDGGERVRLAATDGGRLPFRDGTFDAAFSISAMEHFVGDGDSKASRELARCLKPGGVALLTVPCSLHYWEERLSEDVYERRYRGDPLFWQRHYAPESMEERIVRPGGWRLLERLYVGERGIPFDRAGRRILGDTLYEALGPVHPLAATAFFTTSPGLEGFEGPGRYLSFAFLVLEKPTR